MDDDPIVWLVFGDDWGRHPSTTQHLVTQFAAMAPGDRVVWVDSLGMRSPTLSAADLVRVAGRLFSTRDGAPRGVGASRAPSSTTNRIERRVRPRILPWHRIPAATIVNRWSLARQLAGVRGRVALVSNPVAALYLDALEPTRVLYLRLDRYDEIPGVDPALVALVEPRMIARADVVFAPSARVLDGVPADKGVLLPQGVDVLRFAAVPAEPPDPTAAPVCGYWGWLAEWLDRDLVRAVARANPAWTFELRGPRRLDAGALRLGPNVRVLPPVPHDELGAHAAHWRAAWAPLRTTHHMGHASPLKLREYLAAGFPTASTPLPEARALPITIVEDADDVAAFLAAALADTRPMRQARRDAMAGESWAARAAIVRAHARGRAT